MSFLRETPFKQQECAMKITQQFFNEVDLLNEQFQPEQVRPAREPQTTIPRLVDVRGTALDKITDFKQLDPRQPAVAIIDDVRTKILFQTS